MSRHSEETQRVLRTKNEQNGGNEKPSSEGPYSNRLDQPSWQESELEENWRKLRMTILFLTESEGRWQNLNYEERRKIEKEEKMIRNEIMEGKRKRYGKAGNKKLTAQVDAQIRIATKKKMDLAEVVKNIRRKEKEK